jgi:hypothetical protein
MAQSTEHKIIDKFIREFDLLMGTSPRRKTTMTSDRTKAGAYGSASPWQDLADLAYHLAPDCENISLPEVIEEAAKLFPGQTGVVADFIHAIQCHIEYLQCHGVEFPKDLSWGDWHTQREPDELDAELDRILAGDDAGADPT